MDQAFDLRNIVNQRQQTVTPAPAASRVITVTSGKGGVGKTNFSVNLALWLAGQNKRVVIIDADFGLANIEVLFNVWPKFSFADVINGAKTIPEVLTDGPRGIKFLSGGTGFRDLANVTEKQMSHVLNNLTYLDDISDIILIDTGAGISKTVTTFIRASGETVVITTPEPTSISDSYTLMKAVYEPGKTMPIIKIVLNKVDSEKEGREVYERLKGVSERFLNISPEYLGSIAFDAEVPKAVKSQMPAYIYSPNSAFSRNIEVLGKRMLENGGEPQEAETEKRGILSFMKRITKAFSG